MYVYEELLHIIIIEIFGTRKEKQEQKEMRGRGSELKKTKDQIPKRASDEIIISFSLFLFLFFLV